MGYYSQPIFAHAAHILGRAGRLRQSQTSCFASLRLGDLALNSDRRVASQFDREIFNAKTPRRKDAMGSSHSNDLDSLGCSQEPRWVFSVCQPLGCLKAGLEPRIVRSPSGIAAGNQPERVEGSSVGEAVNRNGNCEGGVKALPPGVNVS